MNIVLKLQNKPLIDIAINFNNMFNYLDNCLKIIYYIKIQYNEYGYFSELVFYKTINDKFTLYIDCEKYIIIKIKQYLDNNHIKYQYGYTKNKLFIFNYKYKFIIKLLNMIIK